MISQNEYKHLIRAADFGHADIPNNTKINKDRRYSSPYNVL